jgi:hypothetical protein
MRVNSNVLPLDRQYLQGKLLVAFNIEQVTDEDGSVSYNYDLLKLPENSSELQVVDAIKAYTESKKVTEISARQARLQLLKEGLLDDLEAMLVTNREWAIEWEYATTISRNHALVDAVATQASLTVEQIDQMFIEASKL